MNATRQYPLPFPHASHYGAGEFIAAASNAEASAWLEHTADWPQGRLALWGPPGCGKTHLLHLWQERQSARLLAGPTLRFTPPGQPLAIDDADAAPERELLHTLNAASEAGCAVLLAGREAPARWPVRLPDLASRLRAITAVQILPAEDELLAALLRRLLRERRLPVAEAIQQFLLLHLPRTPEAVREAVARLDHAAWATRGPATRALAAEVLAGLAEPDDNLVSSSTACPQGPFLL